MPYASKQAYNEYKRQWRAGRVGNQSASARYYDAEQRRNALRHGRTRKVPLFLCIDGELDSGERRVYNVIQFYAKVGPGQSGLWSLRDPLGVGIIAFAQRLKQLVGMLRRRYPDRAITPVWFAGQFDTDQMIGSERSFTLADMAALVATHAGRFGAVRTPAFRDYASPNPDIRIRWGKKTLLLDYRACTHGLDGSDSMGNSGADEREKWFRISVTDVWSITARSFVKTIETVCMPHWTAEERAEYLPLLDLIVEGKEARQYADWRGWNAERIERYNRAELILLGNYCEILWELCGRVNVYPRSFAGPAPFARALQRAFGISAHIKPADYDTVDFQEGVIFRHELDSYYGGRIELAGQGWVSLLYEYDIRSAYPDAERRAPCLAHGGWRSLTQDEIERACQTAIIPDPFGTYEVQWWLPAGLDIPRWGPLPVRNRAGMVNFPLAGRGWYKGVEIQALIDRFPGDWCLFAGQVWESTCSLEHPRAEMIETTYAKRAKLKQQGDGGELVLKLALNSGYGVTAQTAGAYREVNEAGETVAYHTPKTSNISLASWDTAYVRARIYRALTSSPDTIGAATDAVYSLSSLYDPETGHDLGTDSGELGTWEAKSTGDAGADSVLLVAPGLSVKDDPHWEKDKDGADIWVSYSMHKKRGIGGKVDASALSQVWDRAVENPDFTFPVKQQRYKDLRASLHCHNGVWSLDDDWGEFLTLERELNLTPSILASKRDTALEVMTHPPHAFTLYPAYAGGTVSVGYRRPFDVDAPSTTLLDSLHDETENNLYAV